MAKTKPPTDPQQPVFNALLTPHRSLPRSGFVAVMTILFLVSLIAGLFFASIGAWPVLGFFGLDVLLVYAAFRLNYRAARASEEVSVSRMELAIRKTTASGRVSVHRLNPFWSRFFVSRHDEIGITGMQVVGEGQRVGIGAFLNPDDRESFAAAFSRALATVKAR
jgi:uncharacterized membrane protein